MSVPMNPSNIVPAVVKRGLVSTEEREHRHGHAGCVIWLTGLSGAGKSTIAQSLERRLFDRCCQTYVLDGDTVRTGLSSDLGYNREDRAENLRRVGELAVLFADAGFIVIAAFISPFRDARARVRQRVGQGRFVEVFVDAPLEVCEGRDVKGLYARARAQLIPDFTGISAPYEAPLHPEVELRTDQLSVAEAVDNVIGFLERQQLLLSRPPDPQFSDESQSARVSLRSHAHG